MQQTLEQLKDMKLTGLLEAWQEQQAQPTYHDLSFNERLALLVEREYLRRQQQRLQRRLKQAKLFVGAAIADVDFDVPRGLKKAQFLEWALSSVASRPSQPGAAWSNWHWQDLSKLCSS